MGLSLKEDLEVQKERMVGVIVEGGIFSEEFARGWVDHIVALAQATLLEEQREQIFKQLEGALEIAFPRIDAF